MVSTIFNISIIFCERDIQQQSTTSDGVLKIFEGVLSLPIGTFGITWKKMEFPEYEIDCKMHTPYSGATRMLIYRNEKVTVL